MRQIVRLKYVWKSFGGQFVYYELLFDSSRGNMDLVFFGEIADFNRPAAAS